MTSRIEFSVGRRRPSAIELGKYVANLKSPAEAVTFLTNELDDERMRLDAAIKALRLLQRFATSRHHYAGSTYTLMICENTLEDIGVE